MTPRIGSYQHDLSFAKNFADFWLSRFPSLYLRVEQHRRWQNWDKRVYLSFVQRGFTVFDIGANVGAHAVALSHLVGGRGRVIAFEPVPANFEQLLETLARRARYANVSAFPIAVGNPGIPSETILMKVPGRDFTQASRVPHAAGSWSEGAEVSEYPALLTSIDAEMSRLALDRLDFVKVDVEGGELDVLEGGSQALSRFLPLLYCEVYEKWAQSFGYAPRQLFSLARSFGYTGARVIRDGLVRSFILDSAIPEMLFDASADVLLFAPRHSRSVDRFDARYANDQKTSNDHGK